MIRRISASFIHFPITRISEESEKWNRCESYAVESAGKLTTCEAPLLKFSLSVSDD